MGWLCSGPGVYRLVRVREAWGLEQGSDGLLWLLSEDGVMRGGWGYPPGSQPQVSSSSEPRL